WCAHTSSRSDRQHLPSRCIAIIDLNGSPRPALRGLSTGLARRPPELERDQAMDEVRLAVGVSLPVCAVAGRELVLQRRVLEPRRRIGAQAIAKSEPLDPRRASERNEVQMVRAN